MSRIYVIHENEEWNIPLYQALEARGLPYEAWNLAEGALDLANTPPQGVFYNRMSASSHTRGHRYAPEYTAAVLAWLESHGRHVLNPGRALQLELSKAAQYSTLRAHGIRTPHTVAAVGTDAIIAAAAEFNRPFISKHNRAGKGLGVHLFDNGDRLADHLQSPDFEPSVDGILLLQDYIQSPQPYITRVEFVGREFLYAVRVDTSQGFELCPADICEIGDGRAEENTDANATDEKFLIYENFQHPLLECYRRFMGAEKIDVAAFEFIVDAEGQAYTYDINTNTNYNSAAEQYAGVSGMGSLADFLGRELNRADQAVTSKSPPERVVSA